MGTTSPSIRLAQVLLLIVALFPRVLAEDGPQVVPHPHEVDLGDILLNGKFKFVEELSSKCTLFAQGDFLEILRPDKKFAAEPILSRTRSTMRNGKQVWSTHNSPMGVAAGAHSVLFSDGQEIHAVDSSGAVRLLLRLPDLTEGEHVAQIRGADVALFLNATEDLQTVWFGARQGTDEFLCEYVVKSKALHATKLLDNVHAAKMCGNTLFAMGTLSTRFVMKQNLDDKVIKTFSIDFCYGDLSINQAGTAAVCGPTSIGNAEKQPILILDFESGETRRLPVTGSNPVWRGATEIWYNDPELVALWMHDTADGSTRKICQLELDNADSKEGGWRAEPIISPDGSVVAWRWAGKRDGKLHLGTLLFDARNGQALLVPPYKKMAVNFRPSPDGLRLIQGYRQSATPSFAWWHQLQILTP